MCLRCLPWEPKNGGHEASDRPDYIPGHRERLHVLIRGAANCFGKFCSFHTQRVHRQHYFWDCLSTEHWWSSMVLSRSSWHQGRVFNGGATLAGSTDPAEPWPPPPPPSHCVAMSLEGSHWLSQNHLWANTHWILIWYQGPCLSQDGKENKVVCSPSKDKFQFICSLRDTKLHFLPSLLRFFFF